MDYINWLLDSSQFVTRDNCGAWTPSMIAFYQLANALIAIAYFAIPLSLLGLWNKARKLSFNPWIILMFISFILLCGVSHICHVVVFYWAPYRLFILIDMATATVSLITSVVLPIVVYDIIRVISIYDKKGKSNDEEKG